MADKEMSEDQQLGNIKDILEANRWKKDIDCARSILNHGYIHKSRALEMVTFCSQCRGNGLLGLPPSNCHTCMGKGLVLK